MVYTDNEGDAYSAEGCEVDADVEKNMNEDNAKLIMYFLIMPGPVTTPP